MKILITSDLFDSTVNGVVTSIKNLERELEKNGHEVRVLTVSDRCRSYRKENVYYIKSVPLKLYPDIRIPVSHGKDYVAELIAWRPDVVHSQCEFFSYTYAKKIAKATDAVLVHTFHTLYEQYTNYLPIGKSLSRMVLGGWIQSRLKNADVVIAPTKKVERTLISYEMKNTIQVIPTGICLEQFEQTVEEEYLHRLREQYDIPEYAHVLISIGRLGFEKRIDELLRGFQYLLQAQSNIVLVIVGGGPAESSLKQLANELGIDGHVRFTGMVSPNEVAAYYKLGDIFVSASTSETQGLTYIEAMASGLALVCRRDPCLYGVLAEAGNGYTYETIPQFVDAVQSLFKDEVELEKAKAYSVRLVKGFGTEQFGMCVEKCYQEALLEKEYETYESIIVCEESKQSDKKWCWARHGYAGRIS